MDLNETLHKLLHPSSKVPDFKMYPESKPWPILYFDMLKEEPKTYLPALVKDLRRALGESIKPGKRSPWEIFHNSMAFDTSEHYIWHRVIKHRKSLTVEEREAELEAIFGNLFK